MTRKPKFVRGHIGERLITYVPPVGPLSRIVAGVLAAACLAQAFTPDGETSPYLRAWSFIGAVVCGGRALFPWGRNESQSSSEPADPGGRMPELAPPPKPGDREHARAGGAIDTQIGPVR
jgi:hypothetical protein